jgi:dolichol kinase
MEEKMDFVTSQQDWLMISIGVLIILVTLSTVFILKLFKLERWQIRKIGHMIVNCVAAFYPYLYGNFFDLLISVTIAIGVLLILSAIPKVHVLQRIFKMCSRDENFPWELFINAVLMGIVMITIAWFSAYKDSLFIFTAAYLSVSFGDGLGEMIGRPYGKIKYKIFSDKSLEGSIAVFFGSFVGVVIALGVNLMLGDPNVWWKIPIVAFAVMTVEALSFSFSDNLTIPGTVAGLLYLLFLL